MKEHPFTNRLIHEKSPYLLQHAHNPVDWYPWGDEAFEKARETDKPIFLSIGYATCHWCHVMEEESFSNEKVAQLLNETFINIKVDREELPEVDSLYMDFAQSMMSGSVGWPLNLVLTIELQPFFAATYLPPESRHGLVGLFDVIKRMGELWGNEERGRITLQAAKVVDLFAESVHLIGTELPEKEFIQNSVETLFKIVDPVYGGMKGAPKFPIGYLASFLLRYFYMSQDSRALFVVERTLDMMHRGGIYDHLGGGFSRYSVDERWQVPHFEKMLYDSALLIQCYLESAQLTKTSFYKTVVIESVEYILRDMTSEEGAFFSAEDADSEGKEGYFYTWTIEEVNEILGNSNSTALFCSFYGITPQGNFERRNILHTPSPVKDFVEKRALHLEEFEENLKKQKEILWKAREGRIRPFKDDKVLSSWNGLMIYSLAMAGAALNVPRYLEAAKASALFIKENMWKNGVLFRRWRHGDVRYEAGLDEYAFLIRGLLTLFELDQGTEWLEWAMELERVLYTEFKAVNGAFYQTNGKDNSIILRKCVFSDGAEPSGNAIHCENLLRLFDLTSDRQYLMQSEDIMKATKKFLESYSLGYCYHLMSIQRYYDIKRPLIVVALNKEESLKNELFALLFQEFLPHKSVIWKREKDQRISNSLPNVGSQIPVDGKTTLYLCREGVCKEPVSSFSEMKTLIFSKK